MMTKQAYLNALRQALHGLPPETIAKTLAYYEQCFIDALVTGRSEAEAYQDLDPPRKVAMTLRANLHLHALQHKHSPVNVARVVVSLIGLGIFNLFMVIPALVYASLLAMVYAAAFAVYIGGIALVSSGLSGQNELALEGPLRHLMEFSNSHFNSPDEERSIQGWRMAINNMGVQLSRDPDETPNSDEQLSRSGRLLNRAEAVANGDLHITTDFDSGARTSQSLLGFGMILFGIALSLLSIVITRYTVIGLRRYLAMNLALLRGR